MSSTSQRPQPHARQPPCHCGLERAVTEHRGEVQKLQERLAIVRHRNFDLQSRLEQMEQAFLEREGPECGDQPGTGEANPILTAARDTAGVGPGQGPSWQDALAQEQARITSDPEWPKSASPARVSVWTKFKLLNRVLDELWKEENLIVKENSMLRQRLERQKEEVIVNEGLKEEKEEWAAQERELRRENEELRAQIARHNHQLDRIARLSRGNCQ